MSILKNLGIGTDLIDTNRIERIFARHKLRFSEKILSASEMLEFYKAKAPFNFLAKRFVAKEAAVKALGTGFSQGISFQDISLHHDELGAPYLELSGKFAEIAAEKNLKNWKISLSDESNLVLAFVVAF